MCDWLEVLCFGEEREGGLEGGRPGGREEGRAHPGPLGTSKLPMELSKVLNVPFPLALRKSP